MKSPAFQFYPSDWLGSRAVRLMDAEQRGWYIQLLAEAWQSRPQATLPNDPTLLIRLANADTQATNFETRWSFVIAQFTLKGELLVNARLAHEKRKQNDYHQQRKQAGAKGAAKRWQQTIETKEDTGKVGHSSAIAKPPPSHVSANGKPIAKDSFSSSSSIATSKEKKDKRADKPPDPRVHHPAIEAVWKTRGKYPLKDLWDLIIETVGDEPDLGRMKKHWLKWRGRGFSPENYGWLTDWYVNGENENGNQQRETASQRNVRNIRESLEYIDGLSKRDSEDDPEIPTRLLTTGSRLQ